MMSSNYTNHLVDRKQQLYTLKSHIGSIPNTIEHYMTFYYKSQCQIYIVTSNSIFLFPLFTYFKSYNPIRYSLYKILSSTRKLFV